MRCGHRLLHGRSIPAGTGCTSALRDLQLKPESPGGFIVESPVQGCQFGLMGHLSRAREVFDVELRGVQAVRDQLDGSFEEAVEAIVEALRKRAKLIIAGVGKSGNIGQKIAATLNSTGSTCVVLSAVDAMHGDLGVVQDGDVVLALSYSGETEELLNLLPA